MLSQVMHRVPWEGMWERHLTSLALKWELKIWHLNSLMRCPGISQVFQVEGIARAERRRRQIQVLDCRQIKAYIRHRLGCISRTRSRMPVPWKDGEPWRSFRRRVDAIPLMFQKEHPGSRVKDDFQEGETGVGGYRKHLDLSKRKILRVPSSAISW